MLFFFKRFQIFKNTKFIIFSYFIIFKQFSNILNQKNSKFKNK